MTTDTNSRRPTRICNKPESYGFPTKTQEDQPETSQPFLGPSRTRNRAKQERLDLERAMEESLQHLPSPVAADKGNSITGISSQHASVDDGDSASTNNSPVAAVAKPSTAKAAFAKVQHATEATASHTQPKTKHKQSGTLPPAKRRKVDKVQVKPEVADNQPVAIAAKGTRLTRQAVQAQAETFAGKEKVYSQKAQMKDHLLKLPPVNHKYVHITKTGDLAVMLGWQDPPDTAGANEIEHPKIKDALKRGVYTHAMGRHYHRMSPRVNIPVAGIPLDKRQSVKGSGNPGPSIKKTQAPEGQEKTAMPPASKKHATRSAAKSSLAQSPAPPEPIRGQQAFIEEAQKATMPSRQAPQTLSSTVKQVLGHNVCLSFGPISAVMIIRESLTKHEPSEQEEAFYARPSIKIIIPDMLKGLLVDDWENVTKNNQLVPIPHPKPVTKVMDDYLAYEKPRRIEGSAAIDILEETVAGLKEYFDKCLGRVLLYRFERAQYAEMREKWTSGGPEVQGKTPCESYGAEHLMRLITSLPELIAQTNMDQQSVNRLREELSKFCQWLERNAGSYFVNEYESPNAEYAEKAKN
ncbi:MRG-domain-containing protein [Apiospora kogelbergensis]